MQVRRKADGAKNLVKEWLLKWRDNPLVEADPSHTNIKGALCMSCNTLKSGVGFVGCFYSGFAFCACFKPSCQPPSLRANFVELKSISSNLLYGHLRSKLVIRKMTAEIGATVRACYEVV